MLRFAEFMKHFLGSLASCRDRPSQITNNVRVQLAYQITDVTRPQTCKIVCLWCTSSRVKHRALLRCLKAFLFSLVNLQGLEPTKMPITFGQKYGICSYSEYRPTLGRGLYGGYALKISDHENMCTSDFGISDTYGFHQDFRTFFTRKTQFLVGDYEVFLLMN